MTGLTGKEMPDYPFRLALHSIDTAGLNGPDASGSQHGDLFINSGTGILWTYEISASAIKQALSIIDAGKGVVLAGWTMQGAESVLCQRKADHRPVYMDFEGEISRGRGYLTGLRHGYIRFPETAHQDQADQEISCATKKKQDSPPGFFFMNTVN